jgi:hypothetical protein
LKNEKYISKRISYLNHGSYSTIVISTRIERIKETLLLFWVLCWTACGAIVIHQLFTVGHDEDVQIALFIFMAFWVYFEYRIGKIFLWRKWGMEMISLDEAEFTYKRSIGRYGKAKRFYHDKMTKMEVDPDRPKSATINIENSFWFLGGERVKFKYEKNVVKFGRQITFLESNQLVGLIHKQINSHQKQHQANLKSEMQLKTDEES